MRKPGYYSISGPLGHPYLADVVDFNEDSPTICEYCGAAIAWRDLVQSCFGITCKACGQKGVGEAPELTEDAAIEVGSLNFFRRRFYHATSRETWLDDLDASSVIDGAFSGTLPVVHAGSIYSALHRATSVLSRVEADRRNGRKDAGVYLYSFGLTEFAVANAYRGVLYDRGTFWPEWTADPNEAGEQDAIIPYASCHAYSDPRKSMGICEGQIPLAAYVNNYEVPGEMRILLTSDAIDRSTVEMEELPAD